MKKFTTTLLLAIGLLVGFTVNAQAVNAATLNMSYSDYWYDRAKADGSEHHSWHFTLYDMDGEVAYCIQPNVKEGTHYNQGSWEDTGLSNSIKERILLIGYYGYTYPGHQTLQYRAATQGMIWDTIVGGGANTTFHTARWAKGDTFDVSNEKAQIEDLIAHHYDRPSFNGGVYKAQVGETITLTDTNNVLSNYSVSVSGADYSIDGNKLIIKPTRSGSIDLTLTKNMPYSSSYKLFVGDGIQNMMVPGTTDPVIAKIRVNSYTSFVEGNKKDSETGNAQGQATLKGAEYGVYETSTGRLVTTVVTDENGYFKSNAVLSWNDYYLQEIKPSEGYELDTTRYNVDIKGKESAGGYGGAARVAIAQRKDGIVLFLVTEGVHSKGPTIYEVAETLQKYGAYTAGNSDGGASSSLVVNGKMINHPLNIYGQLINGGKRRSVVTGFGYIE